MATCWANRTGEMVSPSLGGSSILNTGPAPLKEEDVYSLSQILQADPPRKYYLSRTACLGILRRARERGKELPPQLEAALMAQAGLAPLEAPPDDPIAFAANQRDEVRDLHDVAGALGAQPGMKQQTFVAQDCLTPWDTQQTRVFTPESKAPTLTGADGGGGRNPAGLLFTAGFCAGAAPSAGGIGYMEEISPTLKAAESGTNMVPSILCLNDQGGSVMECTENISGTLRAQEHGHQPLVVGMQELGTEITVYENHGIDARYTGPHKVSPTLTNRNGTGGNNLPLALQIHESICIAGNIIDRQPQNGGNGLGYKADVAYTLTAMDRHAVYSRQRVDVFKDEDIASTESARQHKDATDLICQPAYANPSGTSIL